MLINNSYLITSLCIFSFLFSFILIDKSEFATYYKYEVFILFVIKIFTII